MHYAVLSDVHANLEALDVLNEIKQRRIRDALFIGMVGYGPNPRVLSLARA
jgi:hypothetical protein